MRYLDEFRRKDLARAWLDAIRNLGVRARLMEVCGTHTMAISRNGLRPLLAPLVELVSGPGCPVCVTDDADIDRALAVARLPDVIMVTFGDMMRVPGSMGTLADAAARGARVQVAYSPMEALQAARREPNSRVVFLGVGFETTAPAVAAAFLAARKERLDNLFLLCLHKLVPPALRALAETEGLGVDGFLLPGHVSSVIGSEAYSFLPRDYGIPCVVAGFETLDILAAIYRLLRMQGERASLEVEYSRAVRPQGNRKAVETMYAVMRVCDAAWRGLGVIEGSGLALRDEWAEFDAGRWEVELPDSRPSRGCRCGDVLTGRMKPAGCPLFAVTCNPDHPVGPCMVSSEGTCASYYLYEGERD